MPPNMPMVNRDRIRLHFYDQGRGAPLLLLHAYPLTGESFRAQWEGLPGVRVIAPDHRGFGQSEPGEGPLTMEQIAEDALAILDSLGIEQAAVGGVSMGGYAAMALLREAPSRVTALALMDTHPRPDDEAGVARREAQAEELLARGIDAAVAAVPKLLAPGASPEVRARVEALVRQNRPQAAAAAQRGMAMRHDSRELLKRFFGKALVLGGEHDGITPPAVLREMAELIDGATVEIVEGAGHLAHLERPEVVNRALQALVR
jgi:pimeloyl-ACP methyl ester carboxylesterase